VFVINEGIVVDRGGVHLGSSRLFFVGVLYAGHQIAAKGRLIMQPVPTRVEPVPVVSTMMNLGICVKSNKVPDFEILLRERGIL
jgi:hypothetical protein